MEKFAERHRLLSHSLYVDYKKDNPKSNLTKSQVFRIVKEIWRVTAENLIKRDGGVLLEKFGYLCHWMTPKKRVFKMPRKGGYELATNYHTSSYWYNTGLFSNVFSSDYLKGWSLDRAFNANIKKDRYTEQLKGKKYRCYLTLVRNINTTRFNNEG